MNYKSALLAALMASASSPLIVGTSAADETDTDEIIVTATPINKASDKLVTSVTALDQDEIARQSAASLGELLQNQPGITSSSFAQGASRPIIRGLGTVRVRVLENGAGSQDVSALSEDHGIPIDPLSAQRVEVIRGPAVLRYGSAAIGGAVSVLNNRVPDGSDGPFSGSLTLAGSPQDDGTEIGLLLDATSGKFAYHADAYKRDSGDYDIPVAAGKQPNSDISSSGYALGASRLFGNGHIGFAWSHFESDYGIPVNPDPLLVEEVTILDIRQDKYQFSGKFDTNTPLWDEINFESAYSDYTHDEVARATGDIGSTFYNKEGEARVEFVHLDRGPFSGAFGVQYRDRSLSAKGEGSELLSPADVTSAALFLFEEYDLSDATNFQFGARIERTELKGFGVMPPSLEGASLGQEIDTYGQNMDRRFTPVSASAGIIHTLPGPFGGINAGFTLQYVERAPDILELFAKGGHEATQTFEIGLPTAGKEKATSYEFAIRRAESDDWPLSFDVSIYHTDFTDFIYKSETGFFCGEDFDTCGTVGDPGVEDGLTQIQYGQQDATFRGFEAAMAWRTFNWDDGDLTFKLRADHVRAKFGDGTNVPRIPVLRYGTSFWLTQGNFAANLGFLRAEHAKHLASDETPTPGYVDVTAGVSWSFDTASGQDIVLGLSGDNLLDEEIRNNVSFRKEDVLQPGKRIRLYVTTNF